MRLSRKQLIENATATALRVRKKANISLREPINVYDLAEQLGIEVRFFDIPSMEGIYVNNTNPSIIVSSLRPAGRQVFTCSHEIGHHIFGHGEQYDELVEIRSQVRRFDLKELQADCFAGVLLMPKGAVTRCFSLRYLDPRTCSPESLYAVANWFGVGYVTLIHHLKKALGILERDRAEELLKHRPVSLRSSILGHECRQHLLVVDKFWADRTFDVQVTDLIHFPPYMEVEGNCVEKLETDESKTCVQATRPGIGRALCPNSGWSVCIRVSRKGYVGRSKYRFEEEMVGDEQ